MDFDHGQRQLLPARRTPSTGVQKSALGHLW